MSFHNPRVPWSELEGTLSGARKKTAGWPDREPAVIDPLAGGGDGGDSPAWSRKGQPHQAPALLKRKTTRESAELHCHTNFSSLDGASHPEELAEEAARLGLIGLAVTDHDGLYGAVRFALAAREFG